MTSATLQLNIIPKRMLTKPEGAHHCGRSVKRFEAECDVSPVKFPNGDLRYDVHNLNKWIDSLKAGKANDADEIIARLA
jgi:hypothetical protein